ncbi:hypothetical protein SDC49_15695 [Lactobacillus sp. R2/2]|nr:hypothetical protein [Lactobacillus sp. R2/2]
MGNPRKTTKWDEDIIAFMTSAHDFKKKQEIRFLLLLPLFMPLTKRAIGP